MKKIRMTQEELDLEVTRAILGGLQMAAWLARDKGGFASEQDILQLRGSLAVGILQDGLSWE